MIFHLNHLSNFSIFVFHHNQFILFLTFIIEIHFIINLCCLSIIGCVITRFNFHFKAFKCLTIDLILLCFILEGYLIYLEARF